MGKLFNLKEWLTVADAAKHLSIVLGEEVTEADVLRLALDGHLKLSVNFVNHAEAKRGKYVSWEETEWTLFPSKLMRPKAPFSPTDMKTLECPTNLLEQWNEIPDHEKCDFYPLLHSLNVDGERFINLSKEVTTISGVWDLPMIGNEQLDIEHEYQHLTGGPAVTLEGLDGAFVERENGVVCQLQEDFDDNPYQAGSNADLEKIKQKIALENIEEDEAKSLLNRHKEDRKKFLEKRKKKPKSESYYPAGGLPQDGVIVVRTKALREFENALIEPTSKPESTRKTENLLQALTCIAIDAYGYDPKSGKSTAPSDIASALDFLGKPVNPKTIRGWLKEGADLLPPIPHKD
ncbi:hypothetical protein GALL_421890 [mine drainage metagenome]|uniref:Uncharacterized protein n=1 Tax=mine drainage metagenome TaxID=410659 RepID=A0A1J5PXC9_9ZZZZ